MRQTNEVAEGEQRGTAARPRRWRQVITGRSRSRVIAVAVALCCTTLIGGCSGALSDGETRQVHADLEGPLSVYSGEGALSIERPRDASTAWSGSFGAFTLCANDMDRELVLEGVRIARGEHAPKRTDVYLRTVAPPGEEVAGAVNGSREPFLSTAGRPPSYAGAPADSRYAGAYTTDLAGTEVSQSCEPRPTPSTGYQELVFGLTAGPQGGEVSRAWVDYTADGEPYSVEIDWHMVVCGTAMPTDLCG